MPCEPKVHRYSKREPSESVATTSTAPISMHQIEKADKNQTSSRVKRSKRVRTMIAALELFPKKVGAGVLILIAVIMVAKKVPVNTSADKQHQVTANKHQDRPQGQHLIQGERYQYNQ